MNNEERSLERGPRAYIDVPALKDKDAVHLIAKVDPSSDSVIAKVRVTTARAMDQLDVSWGDGSRDTLTSPPGAPSVSEPPGWSTPLPQGVYEFLHRYDDGNGTPFDHTIAVIGRDGDATDFAFVDVSFTPLYNVHVFPIHVRLISYCAVPWTETCKFHITQQIPGRSTKKWRWNPSNSDFSESSQYRLLGSEFTGERMTASEEVGAWLIFSQDVSWNFDPLHKVGQHAGPRTEQGWVEKPVEGRSEVRIKYYVFTELIAPMPQSGPILDRDA